MCANPPLVSVVIPSYNYGRYVCEAVESALAQTYPSVEVIVVDDGSTDDTRARLAPYGDRIRYIYQANAGLSAARNTGIREARGEYIAFLDSDDQFHPRRLEIQVPVAEADAQIGVVASHNVGAPALHWEPLPSPLIAVDDVSLDELVLRSQFGSCGVLARTSVFPVVGFFDESLRSAEDRDMWIRIAVCFKVVRVRAKLWWYRPTASSMSKNAEKMEVAERAVIEKAFALPELRHRRAFRRKALAMAAYAAAYRYLAAGQAPIGARRAVRSFLLWPLGLGAGVRYRFGRLRLLVACVRKSIWSGSPSAPNVGV